MRWMVGAVMVCVCAMSVAQDANEATIEARLDQVANSYTGNNAFMGTVLVVDGGRVLLSKGYGMADLKWSIANVPEAKFRLGSITIDPALKSVTYAA